ncbi:MAG TPA: hypothetical protein VL099_11575 [Candidatus Binatia bacterium]|nr:hypothetical protein [Candidatus Binatia bacterium]
MRPKLRIVLSWFAVALGCLVGLLGLARFGMWSVPFGEHDPGWLLSWLTFAGIGLFAMGFLVGSVVAPRYPWRAGIIFLAFLPITAFCLAYEESGFLVWHADGSGWFETPHPLTTIGLTALFFAPFVAPLFTLHHRKRAGAMFAGVALVAILVFIHSRWTTVLVPHLAGYSSPFLLFGLFWLRTHKLGWPPLLQPRPRAVSRRITAVAITFVVVFCLDVGMTLGLSALRSSLLTGDCAGKPPFTRPLSSRHAVFTARVVFVGRSIAALTGRPGMYPREFLDQPVGDWAVGVVQEKFWGLAAWEPHVVLLTNFIYWKGETYFIDGSRADGWLTRILPIVWAGIAGCSRSRPVQDAVIDLRLLREGAPAGGTRLIGYVKQPEVLTGVFAPPTPPSFAVGARINVTGATGTTTVSTDQMGVYQLDGLPPGDYLLQLVMPENQVAGSVHVRGSPAKVHLSGGAVVEHNFHLL